nr:hypothetical protein [Tanacetum cinerariifolium]
MMRSLPVILLLVRIDKIKRQICEGKLRLLDNDGNVLVPTGIVESDNEVEMVFYETDNLRISTSGKDGSDKGYGTNSLMEQWRDSYPDNDYYDPYDDDMYENHDLSEHLQSICVDLDIIVHGSDKGYGTNSLMEQWRDSYPDNDYYDPYDDDMYENHDLSEHLQSICVDLDIIVRGRKKK